MGENTLVQSSSFKAHCPRLYISFFVTIRATVRDLTTLSTRCALYKTPELLHKNSVTHRGHG